MLDSTIVSKRLMDQLKEVDFVAQPRFSEESLSLTRSKLVAASQLGYLNRMIVNHCLYQQKDGFEKIIQTYLSTQRLSDFENSFCEEVEKISDYIGFFIFRFTIKETSILEIKPEDKQFYNLIYSIIQYFRCLRLKKNDLHFLTPELLFEKIKKDYDDYQKETLTMKTFNIDIVRYIQIMESNDLDRFEMIKSLEITGNNAILFDHFLFQSQDMLLVSIWNYVTEFDTLKNFQKNLEECWYILDLETYSLIEEWYQEMEKNPMTLKFTPNPKSIGLAEFLYQITNTFYFVDLELDLENKNKYKISQDEFRNYLDNVYDEMAKFLKD